MILSCISFCWDEIIEVFSFSPVWFLYKFSSFSWREFRIDWLWSFSLSLLLFYPSFLFDYDSRLPNLPSKFERWVLCDLNAFKISSKLFSSCDSEIVNLIIFLVEICSKTLASMSINKINIYFSLNFPR